MKKLIAREMSNEVVEDRQSSNNVVAKLMGLETSTPRSRSRSSSRCSLTCVGSSNEAGKFHKHHREDEIWDQKKARKGKCDGSMSDKHMDLVRRKFMEVTDDKLHRSSEFQEALQVLSSNKDLFVKFLQESNSLLSQHLSDFHHPVLPHPEAKRITVLRPSKAVGVQKCLVEDSKKPVSLNQETGWIDDVQPTRIVVFKPSPGKSLDIKAIASSPPYFDEAGDAETRQVAKEITRQIRETFEGHCRNETISSSSSSVLSNGYIDDDCSLNRSNYEYPVGNITNSEIMSTSSRHSWDCANRFESPFSSSSFSRVSFSPDSSVYREAKKRLSERWAMMSLNEDTQQPKNIPKVSTALGEVLALSETKVPTGSSEESNKVKQETRRSISCIGSGLDQVESTSDSLNTLERSKSVPEIRLNGGTSKAQAPKELTESRSLKSSWKVSSLFFFRNKKSYKDKTDVPSQLAIHRDAFQQKNIFTSEGDVENENQDQPSPVSVLQPAFEEECSVSAKPRTPQGDKMSLKSNLIDKSPPIGSIARVFSWEDESYTNTTKPAMGIEEDENWYGFVKTLLTASGFSGSDSLMTRWHSPESPLDPSLRDKFANKELIKRRKQRSTCKLVFDCVNAIITETTSTLAHTGLTKGFNMVEHVWTALQDSAVSDEVVGKMWSYGLQVETNNLGIEIEVILLQELVEEAVFDLTR
ncbi:hypothetical protein ARALYDRAFT_319541 [Arabidopsis lyrata subsp. lyrata]|uniref:DUF3741 domain-containing protein n=1 Tax=Arabidopsis lyrata subsp. lyrata TaxID=81972 RepID=D7L5A1_ARALL|nr:uncharacterized protein LOC9320004 [Arabidopsis lyrata subsp. lyrata]XP_020887361.1 uncharacterized protein LOC9320004 [Arabidopsis lyrata subsp. lyrata]EFH60196.1 hypothetical protein ARALYDRAFT_319541 [Arabidopsis lyrata subsp. lyrata]|eukprot:XP_002883937.1 uncharacterized protein LOC9320004 [Arabidopsis lyrata subsp. lyrata]